MMKLRRSLAAAAVLMANIAYACPTIRGTWRSSHELTMAFAEKHAKLEARQTHFIDQLIGHLTVRFDAAHVTNTFPDLNREVDGQNRAFAGSEDTSRYKVLFCNARKIALQSRHAVTHERDLTVYHFVDDNTMWVDTNSPGSPVADLNIREYFVRVE